MFSNYATKRITQMTALGRDRLKLVHPELAEQAQVFEIYTQRLSKASDAVLRRLGKDIIGSQLMTKRLADIACDLFVGLCVIARVSAMLENKKREECSAALAIARIFTQQAKRRMNSNVRRLESNEDEDVRALAHAVLDVQGYSWDVF